MLQGFVSSKKHKSYRCGEGHEFYYAFNEEDKYDYCQDDHRCFDYRIRRIPSSVSILCTL